MGGEVTGKPGLRDNGCRKKPQFYAPRRPLKARYDAVQTAFSIPTFRPCPHRNPFPRSTRTSSSAIPTRPSACISPTRQRVISPRRLRNWPRGWATV
ncbi:hypothetical protein THICB1_120065 [Thiomonas arsenitoxydans]|uniref:Transposase n=1 Tax=Thiomonas arsenitoxydans (strain DSM 22701 / CIP 110005 / 3As) TaxID=426114 RepID=A0ABM9T345_THIA3|nr:hypothetical protein THICB1_120065 [Thiomonas arsenitoxydans]CQR35032.1 hypothetical protein THICB6_200081 [Thiomonas arsenitoxydans]CQR35898.1 hypothetical protein ACO3_470015 [Thiomonas arsenitoxydans]